MLHVCSRGGSYPTGPLDQMFSCPTDMASLNLVVGCSKGFFFTMQTALKRYQYWLGRYVRSTWCIKISMHHVLVGQYSQLSTYVYTVNLVIKRLHSIQTFTVLKVFFFVFLKVNSIFFSQSSPSLSLQCSPNQCHERYWLGEHACTRI